MTDRSRPCGPSLAITPTVIALAAGLALLIAIMAMGAMMMGPMGGGMLGGGDGAAEQTPVLSDLGQVTVEIRDFQFFPAKLTVNAGTQVTWINRDAVLHDATSQDGWKTPTLHESQSASLPFDARGTFRYICSIHPNMKGTITVR